MHQYILEANRFFLRLRCSESGHACSVEVYPQYLPLLISDGCYVCAGPFVLPFHD